jgi:hypothetical protein
MERPQLVARNPLLCSHRSLVSRFQEKNEVGGQPARYLTMRKLTCPVVGST